LFCKSPFLRAVPLILPLIYIIYSKEPDFHLFNLSFTINFEENASFFFKKSKKIKMSKIKPFSRKNARKTALYTEEQKQKTGKTAYKMTPKKSKKSPKSGDRCLFCSN